ncbi:MAG: hypothetical protein P3A27_09180 [Gemmatimonadota bacterium]|jgi:hypothetical protein|nr:hypothetical protein [Gemmatimonadota bacterium]MDQ8148161.1 hypothetical protein [Gemmatimonadota bacterium]MDQ8156512.1 hypothetical protein [Gemmatimonadota bacterium]
MTDTLAVAAAQVGLTTGGWVTMILSLVLVWGGTFWCYKKTLSSPADEKAPPGYGA